MANKGIAEFGKLLHSVLRFEVPTCVIHCILDFCAIIPKNGREIENDVDLQFWGRLLQEHGTPIMVIRQKHTQWHDDNGIYYCGNPANRDRKFYVYPREKERSLRHGRSWMIWDTVESPDRWCGNFRDIGGWNCRACYCLGHHPVQLQLENSSQNSSQKPKKSSLRRRINIHKPKRKDK